MPRSIGDSLALAERLCRRLSLDETALVDLLDYCRAMRDIRAPLATADGLRQRATVAINLLREGRRLLEWEPSDAVSTLATLAATHSGAKRLVLELLRLSLEGTLGAHGERFRRDADGLGIAWSSLLSLVANIATIIHTLAQES